MSVGVTTDQKQTSINLLVRELFLSFVGFKNNYS